MKRLVKVKFQSKLNMKSMSLHAWGWLYLILNDTGKVFIYNHIENNFHNYTKK